MRFDFAYMVSLFVMPAFWRASLTVIELAALAWCFGVVAGFPLARARMSSAYWLRVPAMTYIWLFRSVPLLVLLVFVYNLPQLLPATGVALSHPFISAFFALALTETAFIAEIHRGALLSVANGQYEAASALGIPSLGAYRLIVIPQAFRIALPTLSNQFISCVKMTSLASAISLTELLLVGERMYAQNFLVMETLAATAIFYVGIVTLFSFALRYVERSVDTAKNKPGTLSNEEMATVRASLGTSPSLAHTPSVATATPSTQSSRFAGRGLANALSIQGLQKSYAEHHVLKGINLDIRAGEVVSIIGPSGSGKTSLIRTINGLERIDSGEIVLFGATFINARDRLDIPRVRNGVKKIGMVFQGFNLFPHRTVLDNITLAPKYHGTRNRQQAKVTALALLERVGLLAHANKYPHQLSGGQQQRVAIARALAMDPAIVLFDEPTSALDPELVDDVLKVIADLAKDGMTMIIVTHEMDFAMNVSDRIAFMEDGILKVCASPQAIRTAPDAQRVRRFIGIEEPPSRD